MAHLSDNLKILTLDKSIIYVFRLFVFKTMIRNSFFCWFNFFAKTSHNTIRSNTNILTVASVITT